MTKPKKRKPGPPPDPKSKRSRKVPRNLGKREVVFFKEPSHAALLRYVEATEKMSKSKAIRSAVDKLLSEAGFLKADSLGD